ncbi:hypothetical protein K402DRAFT_325354 [Aulographum hederae CBS 113979]|uniref:Zn(2)-C6 fungal-type domain-containing protein n=1 Tax=Aulographum hederae CBS 113979 TaxID=1176131 RepID=A0A6G1H9Z5_9PEZI|nr:hypothetical protein K402DRAFT_325354 [Aulographum hederae CBS 113979]
MDFSSLQCPQCKRTFSQKSSCIRHQKRCLQNIPSAPRKKSCKSCAASKTKCDLRLPSCSRCASRNDTCEYAVRPPNPVLDALEQVSQSDLQGAIDGLNTLANEPDNYANTAHSSGASGSRGSAPSGSTSSSDLDRREFLDFDGTGQQEPYPLQFSTRHSRTLASHSMQLILRIFRTYPRMMERGDLPPFIHPVQMQSKIPKPLANCRILLKLWAGGCRETKGFVTLIMKREMRRLIDDYRDFSESDILASLQALILYTIFLLFPSPHPAGTNPNHLPPPITTDPTLPPTSLASLQNIAWHLAGTGLILRSETFPPTNVPQNTSNPDFCSDPESPPDDPTPIPTHAAWALITAKRHSIIALYLLDWAWCLWHNVPPFPCSELRSMPAPTAKNLWEARGAEEWEKKYREWRARWRNVPGEGGIRGAFSYHELMGMQPGVELGERGELWLSEVGEFGIVLMALGEFQFPFPVQLLHTLFFSCGTFCRVWDGADTCHSQCYGRYGAGYHYRAYAED